MIVRVVPVTVAVISVSQGCSAPEIRADVVADRPTSRMDGGVDGQTPQPDGTAAMDTFVPSDVRASGCCLAFNGANQSTCDQFNAVGRLLCNSFNDGSVCVWSGAATCGDAGVAVDVELRLPRTFRQ